MSEDDRVYLVASSIIATLGVPGKVKPLEKEDLKSSPESGETDGEIILSTEKALPETKKELIIRTLQNTLTSDNLNKITAGETQLKRVFNKRLCSE